jgi:hypothetical protein
MFLTIKETSRADIPAHEVSSIAFFTTCMCDKIRKTILLSPSFLFYKSLGPPHVSVQKSVPNKLSPTFSCGASSSRGPTPPRCTSACCDPGSRTSPTPHFPPLSRTRAWNALSFRHFISGASFPLFRTAVHVCCTGDMLRNRALSPPPLIFHREHRPVTTWYTLDRRRRRRRAANTRETARRGGVASHAWCHSLPSSNFPPLCCLFRPRRLHEIPHRDAVTISQAALAAQAPGVAPVVMHLQAAGRRQDEGGGRAWGQEGSGLLTPPHPCRPCQASWACPWPSSLRPPPC